MNNNNNKNNKNNINNNNNDKNNNVHFSYSSADLQSLTWDTLFVFININGEAKKATTPHNLQI